MKRDVMTGHAVRDDLWAQSSCPKAALGVYTETHIPLVTALSSVMSHVRLFPYQAFCCYSCCISRKDGYAAAGCKGGLSGITGTMLCSSETSCSSSLCCRISASVRSSRPLRSRPGRWGSHCARPGLYRLVHRSRSLTLSLAPAAPASSGDMLAILRWQAWPCSAITCNYAQSLQQRAQEGPFQQRRLRIGERRHLQDDVRRCPASGCSQLTKPSPAPQQA